MAESRMFIMAWKSHNVRNAVSPDGKTRLCLRLQSSDSPERESLRGCLVTTGFPSIRKEAEKWWCALSMSIMLNITSICSALLFSLNLKEWWSIKVSVTQEFSWWLVLPILWNVCQQLHASNAKLKQSKVLPALLQTTRKPHQSTPSKFTINSQNAKDTKSLKSFRHPFELVKDECIVWLFPRLREEKRVNLHLHLLLLITYCFRVEQVVGNNHTFNPYKQLEFSHSHLSKKNALTLKDRQCRDGNVFLCLQSAATANQPE